MRCTAYTDKGKKKTDALVLNPDLVTSARPDARGTLIELATTDQVVVVEEYEQVSAALEEAWAAKYAFGDMVDQMKPLMGMLPIVLGQMSRMAAPPRAPGSPALQLGPSSTSSPAAAPAIEGEVETVRCGNCKGAFLPQPTCPGCGSALTS